MLHHHFYFDWLYTKSKYRHLFNIGSGLFIWLFLWITLPFGIYEHNLSNYYYLGLFLFPFGLAWSLVSYSGDFILARTRQLFSKRKPLNSLVFWSLKLITFIHIIFLLRVWMNDWQLLDGVEYLQVYLACLIMFLLMYTPFSLYGKYAYFHSLVGAASGQENTITIKGEGKEQIKLNPDDILYAQSDDNYIDLIMADVEVPGRKMVFRCTLKSLADQLKDHPQFLRTHRSIIANIRYIVLDEEGPLKSVQVSFQGFSITLPISKSYLAEVERVLIRPK